MRHPRRTLLLLAGLTVAILVGCAVFISLTPAAITRQPTLNAWLADLHRRPTWFLRWTEFPIVQRSLPKTWSGWLLRQEFDRDNRRRLAQGGIAKLGTNAWEAVPVLLDRIHDPELAYALPPALALADIHADQHPDWPALRRRIRRHSGAAQAFHFLVTGRDSFRMDRFTTAQRRFGLLGLRQTGDAGKRFIPDVRAILDDDSTSSLWPEAAAALVAMGDDPAWLHDRLATLLSREDSHHEIVTSALQALEATSASDAGLVTTVTPFLQDPRSQVRLAAATILGRHGSPPELILPTYLSLLDHRLATMRSGALQGLASLKSPLTTRRDRVTALLDDPAPEVRAAARHLLDLQATFPQSTTNRGVGMPTPPVP